MKLLLSVTAMLLICFRASSEYLLTSELTRTYDGGSVSASFLSAYSYDARGNRLERHAYSGADTSSSSLMSKTIYGYDTASGKLQREMIVAGDDTISANSYFYNASARLECVAVSDGKATENYRDSLAYDTIGNCIAKTRFSDGKTLFRHTLTYDADGFKITDTLYEFVNDSFIAKKITFFTYDDSRVKTERELLRSDTAWYLWHISKMAYTAGVLASVTVYDGDTLTRRMIDSVAVYDVDTLKRHMIDSASFFFDVFGNKIREQRYNDERALVSIVDYSWKLPVVKPIRIRPRQFDLSYRNKTIVLSGTNSAQLRVRIVDPRGRSVSHSLTIDNRTGSVMVRPATASPGMFIVRAASGTEEQTMRLISAGR